MFENEISFKLHALVYTMDKLAASVLREHSDATFPQFLVVLCTYQNPGQTQKFAADWLQLTEATISFTTKKVVSMGYVDILPDEKDSRVKKLYATEKGRSLIETIYPKLEQALKPHYSHVSSDDLLRFMYVTETLTQSLCKNEGESK